MPADTRTRQRAVGRTERQPGRQDAGHGARRGRRVLWDDVKAGTQVERTPDRSEYAASSELIREDEESYLDEPPVMKAAPGSSRAVACADRGPSQFVNVEAQDAEAGTEPLRRGAVVAVDWDDRTRLPGRGRRIAECISLPEHEIRDGTLPASDRGGGALGGHGQGPIEEHRLQLKLSKRARGVLMPPGLLSYPRHAGVVFAAGMDAIMEAVGAFSEPCPFAEAVDEAAPASVGSQAVYPCETGGERKDYGSYYIRTNIPTGMSLFMATLHRTRSTILPVRVVVRTHGSVFGDAERLAADNRAVPLHVVRTCAMELGVARTIEAIKAVEAAGAALSLDALADHLGVAWE